MTLSIFSSVSIAVDKMILFPQIIGVEWPLPGISIFHFIFFVSLHCLMCAKTAVCLSVKCFLTLTCVFKARISLCNIAYFKFFIKVVNIKDRAKNVKLKFLNLKKLFNIFIIRIYLKLLLVILLFIQFVIQIVNSVKNTFINVKIVT